MFQSTSQTTIEITTDAQRPCRKVPRRSQTLWAIRPRSLAIIGAVAVIMPMQKMTVVMIRLEPRGAAVSSVAPSQPIITISVALN
ncbi:hypothetical protein SmB9_00790 [Sphingosinicella microcystinivorans]|uniref:Uncharacterized protein n=1 Tax=Sphingosinicella microcystinivorans TaxID=335406 RepID=A0AAD1D219_SPHMI|nr:hypothetical protein SmB9_00790 [Sphingosinicella microcystinivorans]